MSCSTNTINSPGASQTRNYRKQCQKGSGNFLSTPFPQGTAHSLSSRHFKASHDEEVTAFPGNLLHCFICHYYQQVLSQWQDHSFYNLRPLFFFPHQRKQGKQKYIPVLLTAVFCVFRDYCHFSLQSPLLSVKPSSFALSSPVMFSSLSALWLTPVGSDLFWSMVIPCPKEDPVFQLVAALLKPYTIFQGRFSQQPFQGLPSRLV